MNMTKKIENDEQYQKSLKWLVDKALETEHPLMTDEKKAQIMVNYNFVENMVQQYNNEFFKDKYFPPIFDDEKKNEEPAVDLSDWL